MNGFNIKNDKQLSGIQFVLDNNYIVSLVAAKSEKTKVVMYTKCHVSVTLITDISTGNVKYITKNIMDAMNHTPTNEENEKSCSLFMNIDINKFFEVLDFVRNLKKEEKE